MCEERAVAPADQAERDRSEAEAAAATAENARGWRRWALRHV
ncbi:hypothetical protein ACFWWA_15485 [Streptomyces goshikiensis]